MTGEDRSPDEFARWVEPHLPAMGRLAARLVSSADCDDVVQEALVRAWRRQSTYDATRGRPLTWLLAIVADQSRRHRVRSPRALPLRVPDQEPALHLQDADLDLERAIRRLSSRQRMAVDLRYFVDLDVSCIAEVMGCAPGTVKATLHQARARLRVLLGDDDD